jgi:predicted GNAT family acetyltransferase
VLRLAPDEDLGRFAGRARPLLRDLGTVEHGLHLGVIGQLEAGFYDTYRLWAVQEGRDVVGLVLHTPPYPYAVALRPDRSATALAQAFAGARLEPGDLTGPSQVVEPLATAWAGLLGGEASRLMAMHLLRCDEVIPPAQPPPGRCRKASIEDLEVVLELTDAFLREALPDERQDAGERAVRIERRLRGEHGIHLWEDDDEVVALAAIGMPAEGGERVASVYTPPRLRGRGYASALVAAVTRDAFDRGCSFVHLNTDTTNPTSNAIYERLGYERVGAQATWRVRPRQLTSQGSPEPVGAPPA